MSAWLTPSASSVLSAGPKQELILRPQCDAVTQRDVANLRVLGVIGEAKASMVGLDDERLTSSHRLVYCKCHYIVPK